MDDVDLREQVFHNAVREYILFFWLFILLYVSSYATICFYKKKADTDDYYAGGDDAVVYRIALWLCTFTLAVSAGAVLLLPISIVSNEVLLLYPKSYYVQWLNSSLIHGLWNHIFLFSNVALFILMPFAYFFTESEGFSGSRKGILGRVYETTVVLVLLAVLVFGLAWVASALLDDDNSSREALFDVWNFYLPYLYSCISLLGVLILLLSTPMGFARMFTVIGQLVVKPKFLRDVEEELSTVRLDEEDLRRKLQYNHHSSSTIANGHATKEDLHSELQEVKKRRIELEQRAKVSAWRRNLGYPLAMLALLGLTGILLLMVAQNTFQVLIGIKALPVGAKEAVLGIASMSAFGSFGAGLEIVLILYLMLASVMGFYSLPFFGRLAPELHNTTMVKIMGNCILILVLSSALPVLSRTLGVTNFNLLGDFGRMEWLGNFYIVLSYNGLFAVATALCLVNRFTATVRREIYIRLKMAFNREKRSMSISTGNGSIGLKED
ncbi:limb region 1 protein homolog [Liolophura sinensis]|uniref:limb region 1 protein homolog n=1 Tax=Liolophura sinensis TaxID=3198878 RepID=UPI003158DEA5